MTKKQEKQRGKQTNENKSTRKYTGVPRGRPPKPIKNERKQSKNHDQVQQSSVNQVYIQSADEFDQILQSRCQGSQNANIDEEKENPQNLGAQDFKNDQPQSPHNLLIDFFSNIGGERDKVFLKGHLFQNSIRKKLRDENKTPIEWRQNDQRIPSQEIQKIEEILKLPEFAVINEANQEQSFKNQCLETSKLSCSEACQEIYLIIGTIWAGSIQDKDCSQNLAQQIVENQGGRYPFYSYNFSSYYKPNQDKLKGQLKTLCYGLYKFVDNKRRKSMIAQQETSCTKNLEKNQ